MVEKICVIYSHHKLGDLIWQLPYIKAISEHHNRVIDLVVREKTQAKEILKDRFSQLIECNDTQRIAIIPSVSFGIGTVIKNIQFQKGDEIIILEEQFPSNYYTWANLEKEKGVIIKTIPAPPILSGRGKVWNEHLLSAISTKTKCVAIPHTHWADGTKFDLISIRKRTRDVDAYLIIDGTQSVGALPFSVKKIMPDALICGGYKWLMGPYSLGVAYFGERFDEGTPLDNNWMNHEGSENFSNLVNYNPNFKPKAVRYDIGESSNFILVPMLSEAIKQLLEWTPEAIQNYCKNITEAPLKILQEKGFYIEDTSHRGHHLFGIYLPKGQNIESIKKIVSEKNISIGYRGKAIRVSPHVYNTKEEVLALISCFN